MACASDYAKWHNKNRSEFKNTFSTFTNISCDVLGWLPYGRPLAAPLVVCVRFCCCCCHANCDAAVDGAHVRRVRERKYARMLEIEIDMACGGPMKLYPTNGTKCLK